MFEIVRKTNRGNRAGETQAPRCRPMARIMEKCIYFPNHTIKKEYGWCEIFVDKGELKLKVVCSFDAESENSYKISCLKKTKSGTSKSVGSGSAITEIPIGNYRLIFEEYNTYIFQNESKLGLGQ